MSAEITRSMLHDIKKIGLTKEIGFDSNGNEWLIHKDGRCERLVKDPAPVDEKEDDEHERYSICLILQDQDGAPDHWSLYVGKGIPGSGKIIQVKGDDALIRFDSAKDIAIFRSGSFRKHVLLAYIPDERKDEVAAIADTVPPPVAEKHSKDNENCQHWTLHVIRKLVAVGLVPQAKADYVAKHIGVPWKDWANE